MESLFRTSSKKETVLRLEQK